MMKHTNKLKFFLCKTIGFSFSLKQKKEYTSLPIFIAFMGKSKSIEQCNGLMKLVS